MISVVDPVLRTSVIAVFREVNGPVAACNNYVPLLVCAERSVFAAAIRRLSSSLANYRGNKSPAAVRPGGICAYPVDMLIDFI